MMRLTLRIPVELHKKLRADAFKNEISINEILNNLIEEKYKEEILTMIAAEFATLNDIKVDEIQSYSDANVGAENLSPDTELKIIVCDGEIRVTRSDNPWNEPVDVVCGPLENWNYNNQIYGGKK